MKRNYQLITLFLVTVTYYTYIFSIMHFLVCAVWCHPKICLTSTELWSCLLTIYCTCSSSSINGKAFIRFPISITDSLPDFPWKSWHSSTPYGLVQSCMMFWLLIALCFGVSQLFNQTCKIKPEFIFLIKLLKSNEKAAHNLQNTKILRYGLDIRFKYVRKYSLFK